MQEVGPLGLPVPIPGGLSGLAADIRSSPGGDESGGYEDPVIRAAETGSAYVDDWDRAIEQETCDFCVSVLESLREQPMGVQVQGIQELAELKRSVQGEFTADDVRDKMGDFDVITDPEIVG